MKTRAWHRIAARIVLVTFTTCFAASSGAQSDTPATTTSITPVVPTTTAVPTTLPPAPSQAEPPAPPPPQPPPTLPAQPPDQLNQQQLRDLVAPVALYPDVVLASLLPATTNPDQLHDAAQYVGTAQHVDTIPQDRGWDGSVVGLLQFPDVLRWLDQNPAWTDQMGQAVTYQQGDVLQAIQDYRHAVQNVGNLKSNQYQVVHGAANEDIRIEPARPDVVYVPSYDPVVAMQPQPVQEGPGINPWLVFGGGAVVGALGAWALYSIFDNDDNDHHYTNNYYGGGGRRIHGYSNYYYARGRRPAAVEWTPRPRPRRAAAEGWQHPHRLDYHGQQVQAGKTTGAALRPPMTASTQQAPKAAELRREQQQQRRELKQENRQERQTQQQERTQQQRDQRQERKQAQQQQKQMKQDQQGQRREQQQDKRQQQQQHEQEQRQLQQRHQQEQRQLQQQHQQEQRQQRQEHQQQQQEQRQEHQQERKAQHQEHQQQNQQNKDKKKNQHLQ